MDASSSIELLIKTSDQQCPDCNVRCESSWTIDDLKKHLTTLYPGDLKQNEQKLIYAGRVLTDDTVLGQVFGNDSRIGCGKVVHLVRTRLTNGGPSKLPTNASNSNVNSNCAKIITGQNDVSRNQCDQSVQDNLSSLAGRQQYLLHLHQMQQAYFQYMNSYQQLFYNQQLYQEQPNALLNRERVNESVNQVEQHERVIRDNNAAIVDGPVPGVANRDTDFFELMCIALRSMIVFMIFYQYSTFSRFAIVITAAIVIFFVKSYRRIRRNEIASQEPNTVNDTTNSNDNDSGTEITNSVNRQGRDVITVLNTFWLFISSFVTSMIPELPEGV